MATIKSTSNALGNILNKISNPTASPTYNGGNPTYTQTNTQIGIDDDSIPINILNPEPLIKINFKSLKKLCWKKAKESIEAIIKEVVPMELQTSILIQNKLQQDYESLGNLYDMKEKGDKVLEACIDAITRGETSPRTLEVYAKLQKNQTDLIQQITTTQNQMRKYYIDAYLDLQQKEDVDVARLSIENKSEVKAIESSSTINSDNVIVGTDQAIKLINERKKQAMMAKYAEVTEETK